MIFRLREAASPPAVEMSRSVRVWSEMVLVLYVAATCFTPYVWAQIGVQGAVVEARNITLRAGSKAVLQCRNQHMMWRQDHLRDRQRVVHWDLNRNHPGYTTERVLDMYPGGSERVYNAYNKGRVTISKGAFNDGNFSLIIHNVKMTDKGMYTCNLHHHYCKIHQSFQIQLNVTKSGRKEKREWDGEKNVFVVLVGSTVVLPCVNRRSLWRDSVREEGQQQVVHWDFQAPGVTRDQADRLIDLYASGEERKYGPLFLLDKMNILANAFYMGDFSLTIADIQPADKGLYSCHLHHHYCGVHERRIFRVIVDPALPGLPAPTEPQSTRPTHPQSPKQLPEDQNDDPGTNMAEASHVLNVILPESRSHLLHQAGYILAFFLLLLLILIGIIVTTRQCRRKGLESDVRRSVRSQRTEIELELQPTELRSYHQEELRLDYKNNIMKERAEMNNYPAPKMIDLNREMEKLSRK